MNIKEFIKKSRLESKEPGKKHPFDVFSLPDEMKQNMGCPDFLCQNSINPCSSSDFEVLDLIRLHFNISKKSGNVRPFPACEIDFERSFFDHTFRRCSFHEDLDNIYCAIG